MNKYLKYKKKYIDLSEDLSTKFLSDVNKVLDSVNNGRQIEVNYNEQYSTYGSIASKLIKREWSMCDLGSVSGLHGGLFSFFKQPSLPVSQPSLPSQPSLQVDPSDFDIVDDDPELHRSPKFISGRCVKLKDTYNDFLSKYNPQYNPQGADLLERNNIKSVFIVNAIPSTDDPLQNLEVKPNSLYLIIWAIEHKSREDIMHVNLFEVNTFSNKITVYEPLQCATLGPIKYGCHSYDMSRELKCHLIRDKFNNFPAEVIYCNHQPVFIRIPTITKNCGEFVYWYTLCRLLRCEPTQLHFSSK